MRRHFMPHALGILVECHKMNQRGESLFDIIDQLEEPRSDEIQLDVDPTAVIGGRPGVLTPIANDGIETTLAVNNALTPELVHIKELTAQYRARPGAVAQVYVVHAVNIFTRADKEIIRIYLDALQSDLTRHYGRQIELKIYEYVYVESCTCYRMWVSAKVTLK